MKRPIVAISAFILITGCAATGDTVKVRWIKATPQEAQSWCAKNSLRVKAGGCYQMIGDTCTVVAPDPEVIVQWNGKRTYTYTQWSALGHEVKHCFDGLFHD